MKNSILTPILLLLTPLASLPMSFLSKMFCYKTINPRLQTMPARMRYTRSIDELSVLKPRIVQEQEMVKGQIQSLARSGYSLEEKAKNLECLHKKSKIYNL
jgi:hypothetical protein